MTSVVPSGLKSSQLGRAAEHPGRGARRSGARVDQLDAPAGADRGGAPVRAQRKREVIRADLEPPRGLAGLEIPPDELALVRCADDRAAVGREREPGGGEVGADEGAGEAVGCDRGPERRQGGGITHADRRQFGLAARDHDELRSVPREGQPDAVRGSPLGDARLGKLLARARVDQA